MTMQHLCIPCQAGQHENHQDTPQPGMPGLIGSRWECPCRGECVKQGGMRERAARALAAGDAERAERILAERPDAIPDVAIKAAYAVASKQFGIHSLDAVQSIVAAALPHLAGNEEVESRFSQDMNPQEHAPDGPYGGAWRHTLGPKGEGQMVFRIEAELKLAMLRERYAAETVDAMAEEIIRLREDSRDAGKLAGDLYDARAEIERLRKEIDGKD